MLDINPTTRSAFVTDTEQRPRYQLPQSLAAARTTRAEVADDSNAAPDGDTQARPDPTDTPPVDDADNASGATGAAEAKHRKRKSDRDTVATLNQQIARLTARRDAAAARETERRRKARTRYMIVTGAGLDRRAEGGDADAIRVRDGILAGLSERDRQAVDQWRAMAAEGDGDG